MESTLFVYGSLMHGRRRHRYLRGAGITRIGAAHIQARLYALQDTDYPAAAPSSSPRERVKGELYVLEHGAKVLRLLDKVEGTGEGLFRRELVEVWTHGAKSKAWTYFYARDLQGATPIRSGRWRPSKR